MKKTAFLALLLMVFALSTASIAFADDIYEAEDAKLGNSEVWIGDSDSASGKKYVGGIDPSEGNARNVEFTVNVPADGTYQVELSYANGGGDAKLGLFVNGSETGQEIVTPASAGGWGAFGDYIAKFEVALTNGANTLKFANTDQYTQIDWIKIISNDAAEPAVEPTAEPNPKTGDSGIALYGVLAVIAGLTLAVTWKRTKAIK
ncbi:CBM35 domain-containing protein [Cohnella yongneupensis]|uniref:CBM35 domain-containing protein n=1 Tax=Cohnella yongneupensis TaxID=425006 RepID=A0ABW0R241_9BACL